MLYKVSRPFFFWFTHIIVITNKASSANADDALSGFRETKAQLPSFF